MMLVVALQWDGQADLDLVDADIGDKVLDIRVIEKDTSRESFVVHHVLSR